MEGDEGIRQQWLFLERITTSYQDREWEEDFIEYTYVMCELGTYGIYDLLKIKK